MFSTFRNAWKIEDLRKKIMFTLIIIACFRVGALLPIPFVNIPMGGIDLGSAGSSFMGYLSILTGDAFKYGTLFAMSITPYINASIIMNLLTVAIPKLERLAKEGEEGRKKIASYTRYAAVTLGLIQSTAYYFYLKNYSNADQGINGLLLTSNGGMGKGFGGAYGILQMVTIILIFTAGTALIMWMGEQINEFGIGNGISLLLFAGIVSRGPSAITAMWQYLNMAITGQDVKYYFLVPLVIIIFLAMIGFIVWMDNSERRIPVQYAKRVVGRKMYGGQSTHIPIKVNMSGVMPIIFASSILQMPGIIEMFLSEKAKTNMSGFFSFFHSNTWQYAGVYFLLIIFFAYFYATIQYNPVEMANNLRKNSGAVPGIRPGKPTSDYIKRILSRVTLLGALLISVVALMPIIFAIFTGMRISLGGTSILIVVGVALETVKQIESQMMMRHYKGFLD